MDTINDELLACYVEGTATPEEQILVRDYLTKNPEEYERVLYMMDLDREDYIKEQIENSQDIIYSFNISFNLGDLHRDLKPFRRNILRGRCTAEPRAF
jgi:exopolysaccharide biosynthesis predicted pyruvyltransferase EpsI